MTTHQKCIVFAFSGIAALYATACGAAALIICTALATPAKSAPYAQADLALPLGPAARVHAFSSHGAQNFSTNSGVAQSDW